MATTLSASARSNPLASEGGKLSASRGGSISIRELASEQPGQDYVAIGPAAGVPASYADFITDFGNVNPLYWSDVTVKSNPGGLTQDVITTMHVPLDHLTEGQSLYVALFVGNGTASPDDAAVPDAVAGPFVVEA